tara:strand:- start:111 stop:467 length:357 start_codon:yes stop_codon:yes gene_type:complete
MENLAPNLKRQRLLIEGFFKGSVNRQRVENYFMHLCYEMGFKAYGEPIIFSPEGLGKEENQGFDAFLPLIDSGVSVYIWSGSKFFSIILYTCKDFDDTKATKITKNFWEAEKIAHMAF